MAYEVNDGRIVTWSLEAHVVDHCNLRCVDCCSLSPALPARVTEPAALARDLERAAAVLAPQIVKLTGGEPLLHPRIVECVEVARAARIAPIVSLTTNGFRAPRQPVALFELLDRLTLSLYPSAPLPARTLDLIRARCAEHGVRLTEKVVDSFQRMDAPAPHNGAVHATCWLKVRCHLVHEGRFFTCTRPPHLAALHPELALATDGVSLDEPDLAARLLEYLESDSPLASCRLCLGASGARAPHRQAARAGRA